jgi:penicillin amidase
VDHYLEPASAARLHRVETIRVAWGADVHLPVYRTEHGPVIHPLPFSPETHDPSEPIISWKYSHWGYEAQSIAGILGFATSRNLEEFQGAAEKLGVSMHICYADREGTIAYMMTGREPVRPAGEYRLPQGFFPGVPPAEWDAAVTEPPVTDKNPRSGYYSGWNNKSHPDYPNAPNNFEYYFGPFHRAHVVDDYLASRKRLSFEELRDLALYISATDSFGDGGNPWAFASEAFGAAVRVNPTAERMAAVKMLDGWDGHFVPGGPAGWVAGADLADEWLLMKNWLEEALRLTFADELGPERFAQENKTLLFNVVLHALNDEGAGIATGYDWFSNLSDPDAPQALDAIVVAALDHALATLGERPWGAGERPYIEFVHDLLGPIHAIPYLSRSTYAQCVEMGDKGPVRVESMFPLGPSGDIRMRVDGYPEFSPYFFSMTPVFDAFAHRSFPVWGE